MVCCSRNYFFFESVNMTRLCRLALLVLWIACSSLPAQLAAAESLETPLVRISFACGKNCLWEYALKSGEKTYRFAPPQFEVDGRVISAEIENVRQAHAPVELRNGATEYTFEGTIASLPGAVLSVEFQTSKDNPMVRFRYTLRSDRPRQLTKRSGKDALTYLSTSFAKLTAVREVRLSNFVELTHSYELSETEIASREFEDATSLMGPILAGGDGQHSIALAYEHGSQVPDRFVEYSLAPDRNVSLRAVKGNYVTGQAIDATHAFRTIWFETGAVNGGTDELASAYRRFVLKYLSQNEGTRKPYVFYNTWNFQERNRWFNGKPYLESMNEERILKEIDVAHELGIDVFVLDAGWFEQTGDWRVSRVRFPDNLKSAKARLDGYGMKLGLWFGPTSAAVTSRFVREHPEWKLSTDGKIGEPVEVWETPKSYEMCLVSDYSDAFADELIRLSKEVGVTYFKWDAVDLYGCAEPHHLHGNASNSQQERAENYAFQLVQRMGAVADKIAAAVPDAIVDFDITESGRAVGLSFLASGRFFLVNNGPYYPSYDIPFEWDKSNPNLFFSKGPARTWICRSPLTFDKWIPSNLFLTHYLPDDPVESQEMNVASLILGQNGVWGDLLSISDGGVDYIGTSIRRYKQVREEILESDPVVSGLVSGSPEIHEKISATSGKGVVVVFATAKGSYSYVTKHKVVASHWAAGDVTVTMDQAGRAKISVNFAKPGARVIFFGTE
jgi:alpha-galactosidase